MMISSLLRAGMPRLPVVGVHVDEAVALAHLARAGTDDVDAAPQEAFRKTHRQFLSLGDMPPQWYKTSCLGRLPDGGRQQAGCAIIVASKLA